MIQTTLVPGAPWPTYIPSVRAHKHREGVILDADVLQHILNGDDNIFKLATAMGFKANSIRRHLYRMRDEGVIESFAKNGKPTIWRVKK